MARDKDRERRGIDKEKLADIFGVGAGVLGGAEGALRDQGVSASDFTPPVDVATLAVGGVGGFAVARSMGKSGALGGLAGAVGAVALRGLLGV